MSHELDIRFQATFDYRLRSTQDVLRADSDVLEALLKLGDSDATRRLLWVVDAELTAAAAWVLPRLDQLGSELTGDLTPVVVLPGGESVKQGHDQVDVVLEAINEADLDRHSMIVAIGGGAMLDAAGFAAATAHRGIRLIRLPTTTLSQADGGLGVKNAVNRFGKKNWQGTFAVPWAVVNDATLLETLSDRDFRCGFSEAVKVSLLKDTAFFDWLCDHAEALASRDSDASGEAIHRSALLHVDHITRGGDPFEAHTARPLDFGHWAAHRLETLTRYQLRHGEAVSIGLALDCVYSHLACGLSEVDLSRILACLQTLQLPTTHDALDHPDVLLEGLEEFRQHLGGQLSIPLLHGIGKPFDAHDINPALMREAMQQLSGYSLGSSRT